MTMDRNMHKSLIKRRVCGLMLLATLTASIGCGTVGNLRAERPLPYGGVVNAGETTQVMTDHMKKDDVATNCLVVLLAGPPIICDVALSAVGDTLTLPWVFYRAVQPGPPLLTWSIPKC
jgi:uncharacterized protein YceK